MISFTDTDYTGLSPQAHYWLLPSLYEVYQTWIEARLNSGTLTNAFLTYEYITGQKMSSVVLAVIRFPDTRVD